MSDNIFNKNIKKLSAYPSKKQSFLIRRGLEKEGLRITPEGYLAQTSHPMTLGSKLTHPHITTDYSEALLELITAPHTESDMLLTELTHLHTFVYQALDKNELIWPTSMPCLLTEEADIPIANYGNSAIGQMKSIYRQGLAHRYGKNMQTIAGLHFNCSFNETVMQTALDTLELPDNPANRNHLAMGAVRNIHRYGWLLMLLFGASPATCRCFDKHNALNLDSTGRSLYGPYATTLRMSDAGYQNLAQAGLNISYNSLDDYISGLKQATETPSETFAKFGVKTSAGYQQLNANLLQLEAEYYSIVRPKRVGLPGERPIKALQRGGIEYFELRLLDLNPFVPQAITSEQIHIVDCFMLYCLLQASSPLSEKEMDNIRTRQHQVALHGRDPALKITNGEKNQPIGEVAHKLLDDLTQLSECFPAQQQAAKEKAIAYAKQQLSGEYELPSERVLRELIDDFNGCFFDFGLAYAHKIEAFYRAQTLSPDYLKTAHYLVEQSWQEQAFIEKASGSLDETISQYFAS